MNFLGAQPFFDTSLEHYGELWEVDRFDIRAPSSGIGNHPGSRVSDALNQLVPIYRVIVWSTGDLENAFADGSGDNGDKSDDTGLCLAFLEHLETLGGIYLDGDHVATEWSQMATSSALTLRSQYMDFAVTSTEHQPVVGYNPWGVGVTGGAFSYGGDHDTLVVQGGCKTPKAFDVLSPQGPNTRVEMDYFDWVDSTFAPAILSQRSPNAVGDTVGFLLCGFSYHHIRNHQDHLGVMDRFFHLEHMLWYFCVLLDQPLHGDAPKAARNLMAQNVPNPFNPTTTIRYEVAQPGPVSLRVYNVAGQLVRMLVDGHRAAGRLHEATWNGLNDRGQPVASGVYFYRLVAKNFTKTKKMLLLK